MNLSPFLFLSLLLLPFRGVSREPARPKLVVGIVVDQMRWDYLYRYSDRYGDNGFKRLLSDGFSCEQTFIPYLPTYTAPGHACIWTGSVPAIHGIAGNEWLEPGSHTPRYCVSDPTVRGVGGSQRAGQMSPRTMLATTVGDELRLATNQKSRVFGISLKDRASILPAGHSANGAYWYDDSTGRFMTSSFYADALPQWLSSFNERRLPDSFLKRGWNLLQPASAYKHSTADSTAYEGLFPREKAPVFPHTGFQPKEYGLLRSMPTGNTLTLELARAVVSGERLGNGVTTDLLTINLASTDYAGHQFGPNALELEDLYIRLDKDIADFLSYLDRTVGKGDYLLFLTADHGAAHNAQFLKDRRIPAGLLTESTVARGLKAALPSADSNSIRGFENYQVYLDDNAVPVGSPERQRLKAATKSWLLTQPGISMVIDLEEGQANLPEPIRRAAVNGYNARRSGSLQIIPQPGWYAGYGPTGTTHGTWNPYDSHIPLVWYGWKVEKGQTTRTTYMTDIAATLAAMLHVQMPNGCIGTPIQEVSDVRKSGK